MEKEPETKVITDKKDISEDEKESVLVETKVSVVDHVPAWDIVDADFENFPAMPDEPVSVSGLNRINDVFHDFAMTIVKLHDEHTVIFIGSAVGTIVVLTAICCFLVWFCCIRKNKGSYELQQQVNETEMDEKATNVDQSCASSTIESDSFHEGVAELPQLDENMFDDIFEPREPKITEL